MNDSLEIWQKHLETGIKYLGESNTIEAEKHLQVSLAEAEAINVPVIIAFSQRLLATAQVRNQKLEQAEIGFRRAFELCRQIENKKGLAEAEAGLASIFFIKGQYPDSVCLYRQAINTYPQESSPLRLAVLHTDLGQVYARMKRWDEAEAAFSKAGELCQKYGYHKGAADTCLYLGETKYSQGLAKEAKEYFATAARMFGSIEDEISLAEAIQNLSFIFLEGNTIHEALLSQYRVVALFLKNGLFAEVSESYYLLSSILQYAKLLDEAEDSMQQSLKYYKGCEFGLAVRYYNLAVIAIMKKDNSEAKKYYFEALRYFQLYGDGSKIGAISEELTYILKYEDLSIQGNFSKWLACRYGDKDIPKYEVMIRLANSLRDKGNNIGALKCGWKALEVAQAMKYETQEIENFIQNLSQRIRKKK